jgi:alpha-tubulin suppressor-like RCC1 family protein
VKALAGVKAIAAADFHVCARLSSGGVRCWGASGLGQLGDGGAGNGLVPVVVRGIATGSGIVAGDQHTCARISAVALKCWGLNNMGQLGNGKFGVIPTPVIVSGISGVTSASAGIGYVYGGEFTCAVSAGRVYCWGNNETGNLGNGTTTSSVAPVLVSGIRGATQVAGSGSFSCALIGDGTIRCWGFADYGELGDGVTRRYGAVPVEVAGISNAIQVSANWETGCALLADGSVKCWGLNDDGSLGNGSLWFESDVPVSVSGISTATQISVGYDSACARLSDGSLKCWGSNRDGELGDGLTNHGHNDGDGDFSPLPVSVSGISSAISVSAGVSYACALLADGSMRCWGSSEGGVLGDGLTRHGHHDSDGADFSPSPVTVRGISGADLIAAGGSISCARLSGGTLKCWGGESWGGLGDGTMTSSTSPVTVIGASSPTALALGWDHSCAILPSGQLKCWGANWADELGTVTRYEKTPVTVLGLP